MVTFCPALTAPLAGLKAGVATVPDGELDPPQAPSASIATARTTRVEAEVPLRVLIVHLLLAGWDPAGFRDVKRPWLRDGDLRQANDLGVSWPTI